MARIADKKTGRLTKNYRPTDIYQPSRRGRKPDFLKILLSAEPSVKKPKPVKKTRSVKVTERELKITIVVLVLLLLSPLIFGVALDVGIIK